MLNDVILNNVIVILILNDARCKKPINESLNEEGRIIGGKPIPIERFPSTVKFFNFGSLCAGTIINSWCVLTAAHCLDHNKVVYDMMIEAGARYIYDSDGDVYNVQSFVVHEKYNSKISFAWDIALIFVSRAIRLGKKANKALLVNNKDWMNTHEKNITVTGWGWTRYGGPVSEQGLLETRLQFVKSTTCEYLHQVHLTPDMFCLYGDGARDACNGDSGGGVFWKGTVIGVVSHGEGCAKKNKPSIYMNVWFFRAWIKKKLELFFEHVCEF